jgi:hypothetical protein
MNTGGRGGAGTAPAAECKNSLDCAARTTDGRTICSVASGLCVQCLIASDCGDGQATITQDCIANTCVSFTTCVNSLECPAGLVCDRATSRCVQCATDADCTTDGGTQRCVGNVCRPVCTSDNACTPLGLLCNTAGGYCTECVKNQDCAANRWCNQGSCAPDVCTPGATRCQTNSLSTCNLDGAAWSASTACPTGQTCVESGGVASCQTRVCVPSGVLCSTATGSEQVITCAADGMSSTLTEDCGAKGQVCIASTITGYTASCKPIICTPGTRYCEGNTILTCNAKGDAGALYSSCSSTQYCDASSGTPTCRTRLCTPNAAVCNGTVATTCNTDGSGYLDGGENCVDSGLVCSQGTCQNLACTPSALFCESGAVRRCSTDGMTSTLYSTCLSTQFCDTSTGTATCRTRLCTPDTAACNGTLATTCNADGSGYLDGGEDCMDSGLVCSQGTCRTQLCTPSSLFCQGTTVQRCSTDGMTSTLYSTCLSTQYCDSTTNSCRTRLCTPGAAACNGTLATTCNADGSGYVAGGTDCTTTSQICSAGTCQSLVCSPSAYFCQTGTVRYCGSDGMTSSLYMTCSSTQYCDPSTTIPTCKTRICTANAIACSGSVATTCNAEGSGYVAGGTNCADTGQLCNAGACALTATDTVGSSTYSGTTSYSPRLNVYLMTANRTLTSIEQYLNAPAATTLTWVVYEATTQTGTYTRIWSSTSTVAAAGAGYQSSGALSTPVNLVSGRYYAIGVGWGAVSTVTYYYYYATLSTPTGFGSLVSGYYYPYSLTLPPTSFTFSSTSTTTYPQRLTTGPAAASL